jgi:L-ascorbate metabolism protein UlaG (beta-lactamase superfamily)
MTNQLPVFATVLGDANAFNGLSNDPLAPLLAGLDHPRGNSALYIRYGSFSVLVDLGEGVIDQLIQGALALPDVVILTHSHIDHLGTASVDRLARWAKVAGKRLIFICSRATWEALSAYHQRHFEFLEIAPRQCIPLGDGEVRAIDAGAHWPGALNYVITLGGRKIGVLFDRKSWLDLDDRSVIEGLDLAYFDFNQLFPMSAKTGHLSVAENIDFIRNMTNPPRLAVGLHYGTDDSRVLTRGSLAAVLIALARGIDLCLAWPGMTVDLDILPPRDPVVVRIPVEVGH